MHQNKPARSCRCCNTLFGSLCKFALHWNWDQKRPVIFRNMGPSVPDHMYLFRRMGPCAVHMLSFKRLTICVLCKKHWNLLINDAQNRDNAEKEKGLSAQGCHDCLLRRSSREAVHRSLDWQSPWQQICFGNQQKLIDRLETSHCSWKDVGWLAWWNGT